MEQCSPLGLGWLYYPQEEEMGELKRFLVQTTMEMEATVLAAQDEMSRKDEELAHMRDLLMVAVKERDEAQYKCQRLLVEKRQLQLQRHLLTSVSFPTLVTNIEDKCNTASLSSSNSDESIISEPLNPQLPTPSSSTVLSSSLPPHLAATLGKQRPLPEKGRLLQAVMEAGPILQTLLLAGPLPQWQHPPPQLNRIEIPPVTKPSSPVATNKRGLDSFDGSVCSSPNCSKYQRVA